MLTESLYCTLNPRGIDRRLRQKNASNKGQRTQHDRSRTGARVEAFNRILEYQSRSHISKIEGRIACDRLQATRLPQCCLHRKIRARAIKYHRKMQAWYQAASYNRNWRTLEQRDVTCLRSKHLFKGCSLQQQSHCPQHMHKERNEDTKTRR